MSRTVFLAVLAGVALAGGIAYVIAYVAMRRKTPAEDAGGDVDGLLTALVTDGASAETAGSNAPGVAFSELCARRDLPRLVHLAPLIHEAADAYGLPAALLAALLSRESGAGVFLDSDGKGDGGHAYGVGQIDYRYHQPDESEGPFGRAHVRQVASVLAEAYGAVRAKRPDWTPEWQLRGAVAAYNGGVRVVGTQERLDVGTTGNDYSSDVWARARALLSYFKSSAGNTGGGEPAVA